MLTTTQYATFFTAYYQDWSGKIIKSKNQKINQLGHGLFETHTKSTEFLIFLVFRKGEWIGSDNKCLFEDNRKVATPVSVFLQKC